MVDYGSLVAGSQPAAAPKQSSSGWKNVSRYTVPLAIGAVIACVFLAGSLKQDGAVVLEERHHDYLGDRHALSSDEARKQADSIFDHIGKERARHKIEKRKGMSATAARNDLGSFFDTLGLDGHGRKESKHRHATHESSDKKEAPAHPKTTVNIYIKEKADDSKQQVKAQAAAVKKTRHAKKAAEAKARQQQLAMADRPMSRFDREMSEAKQLLQQSQFSGALSQARTIALKSDAPYYTS
mmetsp:Transcript_33135/g.87992  ORF Transcript_33135/g.87992 Transcript_33135/m.87992 type:complete len:240 (+) Transcript_33135:45-764(+)